MVDTGADVVGDPLPRVRTILPSEGLRVSGTWDGDGRHAEPQTVDLAPALFRYRIYAPLRDDRELFCTVRVTDDGFAAAWGREDLAMASTTLARLAAQAMTSADLAAFIKRNGYTLDGVAADLGISRRLVAYDAKVREIPRSIALACRYLDHRRRAESVKAPEKA